MLLAWMGPETIFGCNHAKQLCEFAVLTPPACKSPPGCQATKIVKTLMCLHGFGVTLCGMQGAGTKKAERQLAREAAAKIAANKNKEKEKRLLQVTGGQELQELHTVLREQPHPPENMLMHILFQFAASPALTVCNVYSIGLEALP